MPIVTRFPAVAAEHLQGPCAGTLEVRAADRGDVEPRLCRPAAQAAEAPLQAQAKAAKAARSARQAAQAHGARRSSPAAQAARAAATLRPDPAPRSGTVRAHLPRHPHLLHYGCVFCSAEFRERRKRRRPLQRDRTEEKRLARYLQRKRSRERHNRGKRPACMEDAPHSRLSAISTCTTPASRANPAKRIMSPAGTRASASTSKVPVASAAARAPSLSRRASREASSPSE